MHSLVHSHQKPYYDPWEAFNPTVGEIQGCVKAMKHQCYELLEEETKIRGSDWFSQHVADGIKEQRLKINQRIRSYQARLDTHKKTGSWLYPATGNQRQPITDNHVMAARERPISDYYTGQLRNSAGRLYGLCPFHSERHGSFVIYPNNTWHCFGACGEGGDSIAFYMKLNNMPLKEFPTAVKQMCNNP